MPTTDGASLLSRWKALVVSLTPGQLSFGVTLTQTLSISAPGRSSDDFQMSDPIYPLPIIPTVSPSTDASDHSLPSVEYSTMSETGVLLSFVIS